MCIRRIGKPILLLLEKFVVSKERTEKWRKKKIIDDLCPSCGKEKTDGKRCLKCLENAKLDNQKRRKERSEQGLCTGCGKNQPKINQKRCQECCDKQKTWFNNYSNDTSKITKKDPLLCSKCGINKPEDDRKVCTTCNEKHKTWIEDSGYRERQRLLAKEERKRRKLRIINHYGGKCACCGEHEPIFLCMDHINGGGNEHRRQIKNAKNRCGSSSTQFYKWIEKHNYPGILQVLCHNCNAAKEINNGVCPHRQKLTEEVGIISVGVPTQEEI